MNKQNYFAEIIESTLDTWQAQCWQWDIMPSFGSIVTTESNNKKLFAIVNHIQTGSIDPTRQTFAYQKTHEQLLQEQPQIFEFLKTTFSCLIIGYAEKNNIYHMLAPEPPKIHSFIEFASPNDVQKFFSNPQYLQILFAHANKIFNLDELLLALLNNLIKNKAIDENQIDSFIENYSQLNVNDYRRLKLFMQRINLLNI